MNRMSPLYDGIRFNMTVVSDTHVDVKNPLKWLPPTQVALALRDAAGSRAPVDAFVVAGDTTSRGSRVNWDLARGAFMKHGGKAGRIILAIGNHDCWGDDGFDCAINEYYSAYRDICGESLDKPYFSRVVKGFHIICLGNEEDAGCEAHISDAQIEWFAKEMELAGESGKPVFVFCHQSLNGRHGLPLTWSSDATPDLPPDEGGIGEKSDEVAAILKKYRNVFYFSGHSHMGLGGERVRAKDGYSTIETEDGVTLINLPSLSCRNHHGETPKTGIGVQVEVYDDRAVIRPRFFVTRRWNKEIPLKDGKMYFETKLS